MDIYSIIFYTIIFIIGTLFGSFYTLAVYRIPKGEDITHKHSYCPNCNHKLGFLDLIPVFSYIFLLGKCRHCKEKIRPRYLILEILSGLFFIVMAILMNLNIYNLTIITISEYIFMVLFFTFVILMAGIDKENRKIEKSISIYGMIISIIYMVYLCIIEGASIYRYVIYLILYIILLILDTITLRKYAKSTYINGILLTVVTMAIFTGEYVTINTIILVLLIISIYMLIKGLLKNSKKNRLKIQKEEKKELPIGFYLGVSNILNLIFVLLYTKIIT